MVAVGIFEPRSRVMKPKTIPSAGAGVKEHGGRPGANEDYFREVPGFGPGLSRGRVRLYNTADYDGSHDACPLLPPYFGIEVGAHGEHACNRRRCAPSGPLPEQKIARDTPRA